MEQHRGMKRKTIKKILREKLNDVANHITDETVRQIFLDNVIVTGGSIASMLLGEKINDFDIYMRTLDSTIVVSKYYVKQFNEINEPEIRPFIKVVEDVPNIKGKLETRVCVYVKSSGAAGEEADDAEYEYYEGTDNSGMKADAYVNDMFKGIHGDKTPEEEDTLPKYRPVFMSQNAISLKGKVQFVIRFYGDPTTIHENYDFRHAKCSYDYKNDILDLPAESLECLMSKTLIYDGSLYPICSVFRTRKFIQRDWQISAGQMLKMCWQISEIDLRDRVTLREQLIGCDAAFFHELIKLLDIERDLLGNEKEIDSSYVINLIDRIFSE